jgi:ribonuclease HI
VDGDPLNAIADKAASDAARTQEPAAGTAADLPVPDPVTATASSARLRTTKTIKTTKTATAAAATATGRAAATSASATAPRARKEPAGGAPRTLAARYPGTCPCGRPYAKGDRITRVGTSWGHPECAGPGGTAADA